MRRLQVHNGVMTSHAPSRRHLRYCRPVTVGVLVCVLALAMLLASMPRVEVHAHPDGELAHEHVHHAMDRWQYDAMGSEPISGDSMPHVHACTPVSQAVPVVVTLTLTDSGLSLPPFHSVTAGLGAEPPAPPRRPPIA